MNQLTQIFLAFFRTGIFGFGGGMATLPLIQEEAVEHYHWLTMEEFTDSVAMSNSLPGPIATKMAALIGYKLHGVLGLIAGMVGIVLPSTVLVVALFGLYTRFKDQTWMIGMMRGVRPVVVVLILQVVLMMGRTSLTGGITVAIGAAAFVLVYFLNVHPAIIILAGLVFGGLFLR